MVEQAPADKAVICDTPNATPTEGDNQALPLTSAAASEESAPLSPTPGSETDVAKALNNIAPAAGPSEETTPLAATETPAQQPQPTPDVCEVPQGRQEATPEMIAGAVVVHKPDAGQTVNYQVAAGQNYNLDFSTKDTLVESQGENLVIRFADGAVVILEKFDTIAGTNSKLIVDGCEAVSGPDFTKMAGVANALADIAPAAGGNQPAGPQGNTTPGNSGASFGQFDDAGLPNGPNPLGPLGPTSLQYKLIDGLKPEGGPNKPDGKPSISLETPQNIVDETGGGGTAGDFTTPRTINGPFVYDLGPDGAGSVRLVDGPSGLTHHGEPITTTISPDGLTATGTTPGGDVIFTYTIDPVTSTYVFIEYGSLDHPDPTDPNEALDLPFVIRVTDADGDFVEGTAYIRVLDDAPMAVATPPAVVDETSGGTLTTGGTVNFSYGGDGAGSIKLVGGPAALSSGGTPVTVTVTDTVVTGTAGGTTVFTLTLDPATGAWNYQQFAPLDHGNTSDPNDALNLGFTVRVTDYDGDHVDAAINVTVLDDGPSAFATSVTVDETGGLDTVSGTLGAAFGHDGAGSVTLTTVPTGLSSHGLPVTVVLSADGLTATGTVTGLTTVTVFTLTINPATGAYTFTQLAALDHPDASNPNDALNLGFGFTVTDGDGDTASSTLSVTVLDDAPTGGAVTITGVGAGDPPSTGTLPHTFGEDGAGGVKLTGSVTGLTSGGQPVIVTVTDGSAVGKLADGTVVFTLTLSGGDHYSYTQNLSLDGGPTFNVGYTVTDFDGDTAPGTITIDTTDGIPTACDTKNSVDETGGFDTVSGTLPHSFGPDGAGDVKFTSGPTGLTSHGVAVVSSVSADGLTVTGMAGSVVVYTATVNPATGAYTFTQLAALDHPDATNPNDALNLKFGFSVHDSDGDVASANLSVSVYDDGPSISKSKSTLDETNATDTVGPNNDGIWATATSGTPLSASGNVNFSYGMDGAGSVQLTSAPSTLKHHGEAVIVTMVGNTVTGATAGGTLVFTVTLDAATGAYTYKQYASLDHADTSNPNDVLAFSFGLKVTDYDGDVATGKLEFCINDDGPVASASSLSVNQNGLHDDGNPLTPLFTSTSTLSFGYGEDGKGKIALTSVPTGLYSNGQVVTSVLVGDVITGKLASGQTVYTLELDPATGKYTYKQFAEIDTAGTTTTSLNINYKVVDADGDTATSKIKIDITGDICDPKLPPKICVTVDECVHTTTEKLTFNHEFSETRTWQGFPKEGVPVDKVLIGMNSGNLEIGGNYTIPTNLTSGTPQHKVTLTFDGENAGYSNTLGWFVVGPNGEMSNVKIAVPNSDAFAKGGTVDLGYVAAGSEIEFFIVPNGAQLNNYGSLPAGGTYQFWSGGAPGSAGAHLATVDDAAASIKLYYVSGSSSVEIKTASQGVYFATHDNLNQDGMDHIISGVDSAHPGDIWMGFEDLNKTNPQQDLDYNDLVFRVSVGPACGTVVKTCADIDLTAFVSDPDSTKLSSAVVHLTAHLVGDKLELGDDYTLSGSNVLKGGVDTGVDFTQGSDGGFSLAGTATLSVYQAILSAAELHNTNGTIAGDRTLTFQVTDDTGLASNVAKVDLNYADNSDDCLACGVQDATGNGVADLYVYSYVSKSGADTIVGFNHAEGDKLDVHQILDGHYGSMSDLSNYIKVEADGCGNTVVQVDCSGSGQHFEALASLHGVTGLTLDGMVADGSLDVGRFLNS